jgi:Ca-activated chloride channel family protein
MQFLVPGALLAGLALPAIVFLYFLKVRRPEVRVSSLMFWRPQVADRQANAPWQRLRASLILFLQLAAALALALALMRPGITGAAGVGQTTVVMIDGSPSMTSSDVAPSRFQAAVQKARDLAGQLGPGQEMALILLGDHAQLLAPPSGDPAIVRAALDRARPSGDAADLGEGISLANALLSGRSGGSILLLGDGHALPPAAPPRVVAPLTYIPVGVSGENVGIEAMSRTSSGSVFVRLANYGRSARDLKVDMVADGKLVDVLAAHVDGNSTTDLSWTRLPAAVQVLEARLAPSDYFALDDSAWLVTATPPARKVLLVTAENGFLQRALTLRPGVQLTTVTPNAYRPGGGYDLYVFDGYVPAGTLPSPALVVGPPPGQGPVPVGPSSDPGGVLPANPSDPLLLDVELRDVHVQVAGRVTTVPAGWRTAMTAADDALLLVHQGEPRVAELTLDLHHSDLPLRAAFPILVQNLLAYLLPGGFENQVFPTGHPVALAAEPNAKWLEVTTPDGATSRLTPPFPPFTDTVKPGVYNVREQLPSGLRSSRFVVQFQDPALSRIAPGAAPLVQQADRPRGAEPRGTLEIWPWLAAAALVLLVAEWAVFLRGR